jgi:hypothetical protein
MTGATPVQTRTRAWCCQVTPCTLVSPPTPSGLSVNYDGVPGCHRQTGSLLDMRSLSSEPWWIECPRISRPGAARASSYGPAVSIRPETRLRPRFRARVRTASPVGWKSTMDLTFCRRLHRSALSLPLGRGCDLANESRSEASAGIEPAMRVLQFSRDVRRRSLVLATLRRTSTDEGERRRRATERLGVQGRPIMPSRPLAHDRMS